MVRKGSSVRVRFRAFGGTKSRQSEWQGDRDDRGLRIRPGLISGGPSGRRGEPGARRPPAPRGSRQRVRVGERAAAAGRPGGGGDRLRAPPGAGADDGVAGSAVSRGRSSWRGQTLAYGAGGRVRPRLHRADPRSGRPRADRQVHRQEPGGLALRRARRCGLPPLPDRRSTRARNTGSRSATSLRPNRIGNRSARMARVGRALPS